MSENIDKVYSEGLNKYFLGEYADGYWYQNSAASGNQLYPEGLSKYFDMYSMQGWE